MVLKPNFVAHARQVATEMGMNTNKKQIEQFYSLFVLTLSKLLSEGKEVALPKVGKFVYINRSESHGRNFATGEAVIIPPRKALRFKPSRAIKEKFKNFK